MPKRPILDIFKLEYLVNLMWRNIGCGFEFSMKKSMKISKSPMIISESTQKVKKNRNIASVPTVLSRSPMLLQSSP